MVSPTSIILYSPKLSAGGLLHYADLLIDKKEDFNIMLLKRRPI